MKKRFTLMMMVLCILMSIPLKMMAETVTIHFVDKESTKWENYAAYVYDKTKPNDGSNLVTDAWPGQNVTNSADIETLANGYKVVTWTINLKTFALSNLLVIFNNQNHNKQYPASGQPGMEVNDGYYYYSDGTISATAPTGSETGGGSGTGGGGTTEKWDTETVNRLKGRVYSQGFYLAGNFFSFQLKENVDHGDLITYDDAVFKFQQQKNDATIESGKEYEVYKVEIPASLTAHAQVMYVDEFGKTKNIFGPGSAFGISKTCPETDGSKGWLDTKTNDCNPITQENTNYWLFASRNETENEYSDGMYNLYIAVDATTHEVKKWKIVHDSDKRVAYFISDAADATAMPVYDAFDESKHTNEFSNRFYASVNFSADHNYYVISNILQKSKYISWTKDKFYETKDNNKNYLPTTNKLFLQGNGGYEFSTNDQHNQVSPNEKPMLGGDLGNIIVEYNPSQGWDNTANTVEHLGIRGMILPQNGRTKITSVSMVGDAIPGTLKKDGSWDFTSQAANMIYDDVEQCYTTTIVTTVGDGEKHFRFVGNHDPKINWFEDTDGTEADKMAKTLYTDTKPGHSADANDPNKVNYTENGDNPGENWNILWNRPAGRWTVRLYFYTRNVDGVASTDYYYTITANNDLVLRDFEDVKYKKEGQREILLKGGYKFFRTWSDHKAWKVSKDVDIFIVNDMKEGTNSVEYSLVKISGSETANVIPAEVGVILATKKDATNIEGGGKFYARPSETSYNTLVIPMEEYTGEETTAVNLKKNCLKAMVEAGVVPTYNEKTDEYNYLFGFFRAQKGLNDYEHYTAQQFVLGFWLSKGSGLFYSNSAYLPVKSDKAANMKLGTQYGKFVPNPATGKSMYIPALLFDFANVGGTTGINEVVNQSTKLNDGKYYTLSGQQVEKPTAGGIYIHNGRKFVVK